MGPEALEIYLNDHLAGATAGQFMSRHLAEHHRSSSHGGALRHVADEIAEDRRYLLEMMDALGVPAHRYKVYAARLGQMACQLKLNGRVTRRSGLSSVLELETLRLGIEGKSLLWQTLLSLPSAKGLDRARLQDLLDRARHQIDTVEGMRREGAVTVFG
ncbi:hypothetical protein AB0N87_09920 [Streptomyces sp. NPDC093228]|jgi:hypothetical protein|uniref:hypothetical protein n=1 Tax=unclassified Streptomyces TaxID=2593676 RepID=UPI0007410129|nr:MULTISPECIES: hypothetical protein [unclassified Streptomyces]KUJ38005.1 hypothetical protein ADL25_26130 [Streptomyces sp. NRRL F-5122]MDX3261063.1 hypothetical protein [Streptomyces sp. MI02-2A]REE64642.1 hypothetical protein BX257_7336 [Streptomyces sp. 3212.3]